MKLVHGSLFSGFDAPSVAASWMGWKNAFHCEINPFCNEILKYWFPNSEHYEDITKTDFSQWKGRIDVLTGGFPCQPFSLAGQRKGADDNRYLWPHMLRAIREIRPAWVIGENVAGILTMVQPGKETEVGSQTSLFGEDNRKRILLRQEYVVETICKDLEREGYSVQPLLIPACAVGAPHRRDRVWFIAHCADSRTEDVRREREDKVLSDGIAPDTNGKRCNNRSDNWKERPFYYNRKRNSEEDQSKRDKRKCRTCKNGSVASDSQCSGSGQIQQKIHIMQKMYETDKYRAYVSGFNPQLDSLILFSQHDVLTITGNYPKPKRKRLGISLQVGYGVALRGAPRFTPCLSVGLSYNLFNL